MNSSFNVFEILLYCVLIGGPVLHILIEFLNLRQVRPELPAEFIGYYEPEKYRTSQLYLRENTVFDILETCITTPLTIAFILLGGFHLVDRWALSFQLGTIGTGLIFTGILAVVSGLLSLPFSVYRTFVIEEKFGFNKTTPFTFVKDLVKGLVLGGILGGLALAAILWFFESAGTFGWLWSWLGITALQLILFFLAPAFIMPLFNKFTPLPAGELRDAIEGYARSQKFALQGIFTMDGSKRSTKANAYFTGFGRFRRIVLFDTLVNKHSVEELVGVLAHEVGHFKLKHIFKQMAVSVITSGLMFYLLSLFIGDEQLFAAFRMENISVYASLIFFAFLYSPISQVISLLSLSMSRRYEFEADAFARQTYGKPEKLVEALKKLSVDNLSNLTPHPLKVFTSYTHPPILTRVQKLRNGMGSVAV